MSLKHACHLFADKAVKSILAKRERLPTYYGGRIIWPTRSNWQSIYSRYEPYMADAMRDLLRLGSTFWDVGAHVGWFSLFASSLVGPGGLVEAFEPSPQVFHALSLNVACRTNVRAHHTGIGDSDEFHDFSSQGMSSAASFVEEVTKINAKYLPNTEIVHVHVRIMTLDGVLTVAWRAPDLMKIDIEGYELRALLGGSTLLRTCKPAILMEIHPRQLMLSGGNESAIFEILKSHKYSWTTLNKNENSIYTILAT